MDLYKKLFRLKDDSTLDDLKKSFKSKIKKYESLDIEDEDKLLFITYLHKIYNKAKKQYDLLHSTKVGVNSDLQSKLVLHPTKVGVNSDELHSSLLHPTKVGVNSDLQSKLVLHPTKVGVNSDERSSSLLPFRKTIQKKSPLINANSYGFSKSIKSVLNKDGTTTVNEELNKYHNGKTETSKKTYIIDRNKTIVG